MADKRFDDILKNKLDQHRVDQPADWDVFSQKMADASFDEDIKSELEAHTKGTPDWSVFSGKLTDALSDNAQFDHDVREAFNDYATGTADWNDFADKLNAAQNPDASFDALIKQKMAHTEKGKADWDTFAQKLHKEHDAAFDEEVVDTLQKHRRNYVSEHWLILQERLKQIAYLKGSVIRIKLLELACMIALLLTSYNVFNYVWSKQVIAGVEKTAELNASGQDQVFSADQMEGERPQEPSASIVKNTFASNKTSIQENKTQIVLPSENAHVSSLHERSSQASNASNGNEYNPFMSTRRQDGTRNIDSVSKNRENVHPSTVGIKKEVLSLATLNQKTIATLASLDKEIMGISLALSPIATSQDQLQDDCNRNGWNVSLALEVGVDRFNVLTPYDPTFDVEAYDQQGTSASQSVLLGLNYGNVGLETGLSRSRMEYSPVGIIDTFGNEATNTYFVKSLDKISYDYRSIPMQLSYAVNISPQWRIFASTGMSYHWIKGESYDAPQVSVDHKEVNNKGEKSEASAVDVQLDLASLRANNFWRFKSTIGLERCFGRYGSLYVRPSYEQSMLNTFIGPNRDRFNQWNVSIGYKYSFIK